MDLEEQSLAICRTCLSKSNNMENIFNVADIIMRCAPIQLEQDDGLPSTICSDCVVLAKKAIGFRLLCEHSDKILRKYLSQNNSATIKLEKCDLDSVELHTDFSSNDSQTKISSTNEINKTEVCNIYEEIFEVHKNEFFDDENKLFEVHKNEFLTENQTLCDTVQVVKFQDNKTDPQAATNNENKKKNLTSDEKKDKISSDMPDNECVGSQSKSDLTCQYCSQKFLLKKNLQSHEKRHVEGIKCHHCGKGFQKLKQLQNHLHMHKRKGVHACPTCGKKYTFPENLAVHQRIHTGTKPYSCRFCNKSFTQWNAKKSHEVIHTSEKAYLCSVCGSKFARSQSLLSHTRRVHFNVSEDKPYSCTLCDKKFKVRRDLTNHMHCHSDKRNFVCEVCNKTFKRKQYLKLHEKIHSEVELHVCSICQRAFLQKQALSSHLLTHAP